MPLPDFTPHALADTAAHRAELTHAAFRTAFDWASEPMLVLSAGALEIVAANSAFAAWSERGLAQLQGELFPRLAAELFGGAAAEQFAAATLSEEPAPFFVALSGSEPRELVVRRAAGNADEQWLVLVVRSAAAATGFAKAPPAHPCDALTGLANRAALFQAGGEWLAQHGQAGAALFLDLDDFKQVNDRYGHLAGDCVLEATAVRLHGCVRPLDFVARYAGDEFVVLLAHVAGGHELERICDRVERAVSQPVSWQGQTLPVSASAGAAILTAETSDFAALLHAADRAMYRRKAERRS